MKVRVFHLDWSLANSDSLVGKMVSILQALGGHRRDSMTTKIVNRLFTEEIEAYTHVATVVADSLNDVFRLTNTINWPWWENDAVDAIVENTRSTSVGDLYLLIRPVGLLEVPA